MGAVAEVEDRNNPFESFIEERIKYRSLTGQFVIALVAGLGLALGIGGIYSLMYPTQAETVYGGLMFVLMFIYILIPTVFWFSLSVVTFIIARILGARAEFGTIFRGTGWGLVPLVGTALSLSVGRYVALSSAYSNVCDYSDIVCGFAQQVTITEQVDHVFGFSGTAVLDPVFIGFFVLAGGFYVLTWYLMAVAADEATTLTRAGSLIAVGVPMLVIGAFYTYNTFF